jgi:hypothetical protein
VVHHEFVPQGQTVDAAFYVEVLKRLRERVRRVWPELLAEENRILHHDSAPLHSALIVPEFFVKNKMITTDHPSYSPDLAPCDFFSLQSENVYAGWTFWGCREYQMWNDESSEEPNFAGHATLFSTMGKPLGQVHSLGGRVLWGWPHAHSRIIQIRFLVSSVQEHFVHTRYVLSLF